MPWPYLDQNGSQIASSLAQVNLRVPDTLLLTQRGLNDIFRAMRKDLGALAAQVNLNHRMLRTLSDESGLDASDIGLSGNTVFTDLFAAEGDSELYWDPTLERGKTLKESLDYLNSTVTALAVPETLVTDIAWEGVTENATPTDIYPVGATASLAVARNTAATFDIIVTAKRTDLPTECSGFRIFGVIENVAGTTALFDTVDITAKTDGGAWMIDVTADDANDRLVLTATGEASKTIRWKAIGRVVVAGL